MIGVLDTKMVWFTESLFIRIDKKFDVDQNGLWSIQIKKQKRNYLPVRPSFFVFRVKSRTWWQPPILIVSFFLFRRQLKKEQVYFDGKQREGKKVKNTVLVWFRDLQEVILVNLIVKKE